MFARTIGLITGPIAQKAVVATLLVATLAGCSKSGPSTEELQKKVSQLETENQQLKQQVNDLIQKIGPAASSATGETTVAAAVIPSTSPHFTDIADLQTKPLLDDLTALGVFDGMTPEFKPNQPITRGEFVTWVFKAYNKLSDDSSQIRLAPGAAPFFKDLPATHPAYPYAQALANAGYSVGYDDKTFKPDQPLTREELIGIKVGVDVGKALPPDPSQMNYVWKFSDSAQIDKRYTGYILQDNYVSGKYGSNIARAFGKIGTFHPKQPVTRAEAAATLWQMDSYGNFVTAEKKLEKLAEKKS